MSHSEELFYVVVNLFDILVKYKKPKVFSVTLAFKDVQYTVDSSQETNLQHWRNLQCPFSLASDDVDHGLLAITVHRKSKNLIQKVTKSTATVAWKDLVGRHARHLRDDEIYQGVSIATKNGEPTITVYAETSGWQHMLGMLKSSDITVALDALAALDRLSSSTVAQVDPETENKVVFYMTKPLWEQLVVILKADKDVTRPYLFSILRHLCQSSSTRPRLLDFDIFEQLLKLLEDEAHSDYQMLALDCLKPFFQSKKNQKHVIEAGVLDEVVGFIWSQKNPELLSAAIQVLKSLSNKHVKSAIDAIVQRCAAIFTSMKEDKLSSKSLERLNFLCMFGPKFKEPIQRELGEHIFKLSKSSDSASAARAREIIATLDLEDPSITSLFNSEQGLAESFNSVLQTVTESSPASVRLQVLSRGLHCIKSSADNEAELIGKTGFMQLLVNCLGDSNESLRSCAGEVLTSLKTVSEKRLVCDYNVLKRWSAVLSSPESNDELKELAIDAVMPLIPPFHREAKESGLLDALVTVATGPDTALKGPVLECLEMLSGSATLREILIDSKRGLLQSAVSFLLQTISQETLMRAVHLCCAAYRSNATKSAEGIVGVAELMTKALSSVTLAFHTCDEVIPPLLDLLDIVVHKVTKKVQITPVCTQFVSALLTQLHRCCTSAPGISLSECEDLFAHGPQAIVDTVFLSTELDMIDVLEMSEEERTRVVNVIADRWVILAKIVAVIRPQRKEEKYFSLEMQTTLAAKMAKYAMLHLDFNLSIAAIRFWSVALESLSFSDLMNLNCMSVVADIIIDPDESGQDKDAIAFLASHAHDDPNVHNVGQVQTLLEFSDKNPEVFDRLLTCVLSGYAYKYGVFECVDAFLPLAEVNIDDFLSVEDGHTFLDTTCSYIEATAWDDSEADHKTLITLLKIIKTCLDHDAVAVKHAAPNCVSTLMSYTRFVRLPSALDVAMRLLIQYGDVLGVPHDVASARFHIGGAILDKCSVGVLDYFRIRLKWMQSVKFAYTNVEVDFFLEILNHFTKFIKPAASAQDWVDDIIDPAETGSTDGSVWPGATLFPKLFAKDKMLSNTQYAVEICLLVLSFINSADSSRVYSQHKAQLANGIAAHLDLFANASLRIAAVCLDSFRRHRQWVTDKQTLTAIEKFMLTTAERILTTCAHRPPEFFIALQCLDDPQQWAVENKDVFNKFINAAQTRAAENPADCVALCNAARIANAALADPEIALNAAKLALSKHIASPVAMDAVFELLKMLAKQPSGLKLSNADLNSQILVALKKHCGNFSILVSAAEMLPCMDWSPGAVANWNQEALSESLTALLHSLSSANFRVALPVIVRMIKAFPAPIVRAAIASFDVRHWLMQLPSGEIHYGLHFFIRIKQFYSDDWYTKAIQELLHQGANPDIGLNQINTVLYTLYVFISELEPESVEAFLDADALMNLSTNFFSNKDQLQPFVAAIGMAWASHLVPRVRKSAKFDGLVAFLQARLKFYRKTFDANCFGWCFDTFALSIVGNEPPRGVLFHRASLEFWDRMSPRLLVRETEKDSFLANIDPTLQSAISRYAVTAGKVYFSVTFVCAEDRGGADIRVGWAPDGIFDSFSPLDQIGVGSVPATYAYLPVKDLLQIDARAPDQYGPKRPSNQLFLMENTVDVLLDCEAQRVSFLTTNLHNGEIASVDRVLVPRDSGLRPCVSIGNAVQVKVRFHGDPIMFHGSKFYSMSAYRSKNALPIPSSSTSSPGPKGSPGPKAMLTPKSPSGK